LAVSFIDSAKASTRADGDTTGISVTHGFTLADGDVLYAFLTRTDDLGTAWAGSGTTWVQIANGADTAANDMLSTVLRRVIVTASGEPSSYTFVTGAGAGTNQQVAILVQTRGADTTTPEEVLWAMSYGTNDFTPPRLPTPVGVSEDGALVLAFHAACMNDGVSGKTGGAPGTMALAESEEEISAGQLGAFGEVAYESWDIADGNVTTASWTGSPNDATSEHHICVIAVLPAATGAFDLDAQDDAYAVTGTAATVIAARMVSSDPGTYTYTGVLASLLTTRLVSSDPGVYAVTGSDATLAVGRFVSVDPGSYAVTGSDADLVFATAGAFTVNAEPGTYTVTGVNATTAADRLFNAALGSYTVTGTAADLVAGTAAALDAQPGTYTVTGAPLGFGQSSFPAGRPGYIGDYGRGRIDRTIGGRIT
jgi:hypothetical protein